MNATINAVLVKVSISIFPNTRQDRAITDEVKMRKALGEGAGKWVKHKLPDECLDGIRSFAGEARQWHYNHTVPWEEGYRLLNQKAHVNYEEKMQNWRAGFFKLVDQFAKDYPAWVEKAKIMHAGTFDADDYPQDPKGFFGFGMEFTPVPSAQHFNHDMQKLYGDALEDLNAKRIEQAVADTWKRLLIPVQAMADKLSSPDAIFRDTLVLNVREMVELVPELDLTEDNTLKLAASLIKEQLGKLNPDTLRENKVTRQDVAEKAKALAERFGAMGSRKMAA